ncbi:transposase [Legionella taurinensis]|nr:transposase [Legionella taurinensis]STY64931.1 transposase [Legionella taurinensis]
MVLERGLKVDHSTIYVKGTGSSAIPEKLTMDKSGANKAGIDTLNLHLVILFILGGIPLQIKVRQSNTSIILLNKTLGLLKNNCLVSRFH